MLQLRLKALCCRCDGGDDYDEDGNDDNDGDDIDGSDDNDGDGNDNDVYGDDDGVGCIGGRMDAEVITKQ